MSQAPYMPVFTDALLGDTLNLTAEEFGAYCLILFATWNNGGVPFRDDDKLLRRIVRCSAYKWPRLRAVLVQFFDLDDGTWRQKRLEKEWKRTQKIVATKGPPDEKNPITSQKFPPTPLIPNETEKQPKLGQVSSSAESREELTLKPPSAAVPHARARGAPLASPPDGGQGREPPLGGVARGGVPPTVIQQATECWGAEVAQHGLVVAEKRQRRPGLRSVIGYYLGVCKKAANPQTSAPASPPRSGPPAWMANLSLDELRAMVGAAA